MASKKRSSQKRRKATLLRLDAHRRIHLTPQLVEDAGFQAGDFLIVAAEGPGQISLRSPRNTINELAGQLTGVFPVGAVESLRREW